MQGIYADDVRGPRTRTFKDGVGMFGRVGVPWGGGGHPGSAVVSGLILAAFFLFQADIGWINSG